LFRRALFAHNGTSRGLAVFFLSSLQQFRWQFIKLHVTKNVGMRRFELILELQNQAVLRVEIHNRFHFDQGSLRGIFQRTQILLIVSVSRG
jgi:hypothetical protein